MTDERMVQEFEEIFSKQIYEQLNLRSLVSANIPEALDNPAFEKLQAEFSSLMPRYIELHSTLEFYRELFAIEDIDQLKSITAEEEDPTQETKRDLKKSIESCAVDEENIQKYLADLCQKRKSMETLQKNNTEQEGILQKKRLELKQKQEMNRQKKENLERQMNSFISTLTEGEILSERQTSSIQSLNAQKSHLEESVLDAKATVRELQQELAKSEQKVAAIAVDELLNQNSCELGRMENIRNWYASMTEITQSLSGLTVVRAGENDMDVRILQSYTATFKFVDHSDVIERLTIDPSNVAVGDILAHNDMRTLLIELRSRVFSRVLLERDISVLSNIYETKIFPGGLIDIAGNGVNLLIATTANYSRDELEIKRAQFMHPREGQIPSDFGRMFRLPDLLKKLTVV